MIKTSVLAAITLASLALSLSPAQAGSANRAWVSGHGSDAAGCGAPTNPCRTFQYVHDNVIAAGGEIAALDPAGYGPLTIAQAVSVQGHGFASISATSGGDAIVISAGASDTILLNGLLLDGEGAGRDGVLVNAAGSVQIVNCVIRHFDHGVDYEASDAAVLSISNTITSDEVGPAAGGALGVLIQPQSGNPRVMLDAINATHDNRGVVVAGGQVMLSNSNLSNNNYGLLVGGGQILVKNSVLSNNGDAGVWTFSPTWLAGAAIYGNGTGVLIQGGAVNSFGDNDIANNGADVSGGSMTSVSPQ